MSGFKNKAMDAVKKAQKSDKVRSKEKETGNKLKDKFSNKENNSSDKNQQ